MTLYPLISRATMLKYLESLIGNPDYDQEDLLSAISFYKEEK